MNWDDLIARQKKAYIQWRYEGEMRKGPRVQYFPYAAWASFNQNLLKAHFTLRGRLP
jgi:hypothetical protein